MQEEEKKDCIEPVGESAECERDLVLKRLLLAHEAWFTVTRDYEFGGRRFPGYAEFHSHGEKYVLVKRAKLWEVDAHEYLFFEAADCLTAEDTAELISYMKEEALKKVDPVPNHMNSFISLVIVANSVTEEAAKLIKKTSFHKEFKMGFRGWADLRLAAVDLSERTVLVNAAGKEMRASLENNAGFPSSSKKLFKRR